MFITSVVVICILLVVLIILHRQTNTIFQSIIIWVMIYIISYWCSSCVGISIISSILLILILSFVRCNRHVLEKFDDKIDEDNKKDEDNKDDEKKVIAELLKSVKKEHLRNTDDKKVDKTSDDMSMIDIESMLKVSSVDDDTSAVASEIPADQHTPASAQREAFRLINTVKQLDSTLKTLSPTLTQGKQIIDMMKKLNL